MIIPDTTVHLCEYTMVVNGNGGEDQLTVVHVPEIRGHRIRFTIVQTRVDGHMEINGPLTLPIHHFDRMLRDHLHTWCNLGIPPGDADARTIAARIDLLHERMMRHVRCEDA
jgi:hypothetical protein